MHTVLEIGLSNALVATLLALVAWMGSRICRRPAVAHGLWLIVLVKLLTPPLLRVPVSWDAATPLPPAEPATATLPATSPEPPDREVLLARLQSLEQSPAEPSTEPTELAVGIWQGIALLWLTGSALWFGWTAAYLVRFRRLLRPAAVAPADLQARVEELGRRLGLCRAPRLALIPGRLSPMVWLVLGRPWLLFPAGLLEHLNISQRDTLILHELAHLARRDHWVRWLELLASGLYWWLPVVWLARRELHAAEEECCDARVIQVLPGSARAYALGLVQTLAFLSPSRQPSLPVAASGVGPVSQIQRRLMMILGNHSRPTGTRLGGMALLALALLGLPCVPSLAQQPSEPSSTPAQLRQQQIEVLRQLLKTLEDQQQAAAKAARADVPQSAVKALQEWIQVDAAPRNAAQSALELLQQSQADAAQARVRRNQAQQKLDQAAQARTDNAYQAKEVQMLEVQIAQAKADLEAAKGRLEQLQAALKQLAQANPTPNAAAGSPTAAYLRQRLEALDRQLKAGKLSGDTERQVRDERAQVEKLLKSLAGAAPSRNDFQVIRLRTGKVADLAKLLNEAFHEAALAPFAVQAQKNHLRIIADPTTNTLLIQSTNPEDLAKIRKLVETLTRDDQPKN